MRTACLLLLIVLVWQSNYSLAPGGEKASQPVNKIIWETDYPHAMDLANQQRKMLLIFFQDPKNLQSVGWKTRPGDRGHPAEAARLGLPPLAAGRNGHFGGQGSRSAEASGIAEMLGRPGMAIADFVHADPKLHGFIVSVFPLTAGMFYGPAEMKVILDLPSGTLTQRTLIYAVRIIPRDCRLWGLRTTACSPRPRVTRNIRPISGSRAITAGARGFPDCRRSAFAAGGLCGELAGAESGRVGRRVRSLLAAVFRPLECRPGPQSGLRLRHETRCQRRLVRDGDICRAEQGGTSERAPCTHGRERRPTTDSVPFSIMVACARRRLAGSHPTS